MNITLVNPPGLKPSGGLQMHTPNPPLGLAYLTAAARQAGHEVAGVDAVGEAPDQISVASFRGDYMVQGLRPDQIVERIPDDTDVIGVTCMFSGQWLIARQILARLRERFRDRLLLCGGEHMSALPQLVLATSPADAVVCGEGEETLVDLLDSWQRGDCDLAAIDGLAFRDREGDIRTTPRRARNVMIDDIPWPDWSVFPIDCYIERHQMHGVNRGRAMPVIATRGCPYECTFCSSPLMWTQRWLARDPSDLADEIESYIERYRATDFHFQDLTAIIRKDWIIKFAQEITQRGLDITWQLPSGTRSEAIDDEVCAALYRSGCRNLAYAPESGSEEIRRVVKKRVKIDRMLTSIHSALEQGLSLSCFFVIGFPDDTCETLKETRALVRKLAWIGLHDVGVAKFVPYPGSELFARYLEEGLVTLDDDYFLSLDAYADGVHSTSFCPGISSRRLHLWHLELLATFYVISVLRYPLRTLRNALRVLFGGVEETRYAKMLRDVFSTRTRWRRRLATGAVPKAGGDTRRYRQHQ